MVSARLCHKRVVSQKDYGLPAAKSVYYCHALVSPIKIKTTQIIKARERVLHSAQRLLLKYKASIDLYYFLLVYFHYSINTINMIIIIDEISLHKALGLV